MCVSVTTVSPAKLNGSKHHLGADSRMLKKLCINGGAHVSTSNAKGPRDAALCKNDNIVHTEYNYQAISVSRWQIAKQTDKHRLLAHI